MSDRDYWHATTDRPAFWATVPATKAMLVGLSVIHVVRAVLLNVDGVADRRIVDLLALWPGDAVSGLRVWQLVTCALLHGDLWHLVVNCIGIWFFGRLVEERLGTRKFLLFSLGSVLTASLGFLLFAAVTDVTRPMIGASGLDFGLVVLCAFWYPGMRILLFFLLPAPLWAAAALFVVIEAMMLLERGGGIAHAAHLGGALYGFLHYRYAGEIDRLLGSVDAWRARRRRRRADRARRDDLELRREVDRILDKVNEEGMAALTEAERRILKEASERLRR